LNRWWVSENKAVLKPCSRRRISDRVVWSSGMCCQPAGTKISPSGGSQFLKGQVLRPVWMALRAGSVGSDSG
jgi:hypothetical protein